MLSSVPSAYRNCTHGSTYSRFSKTTCSPYVLASASTCQPFSSANPIFPTLLLIPPVPIVTPDLVLCFPDFYPRGPILPCCYALRERTCRISSPFHPSAHPA